MSPDKWDEEKAFSAAGSGDDVPGIATGPRRKFEDEEDEDVLDSWDAADDSEVERKAKAAADGQAKAEAEAKAKKKSRMERIAEHKALRARQRAEGGEETDEDETEAERRLRLRHSEKEADLKHAEDLFDEVGVISGRKATTAGTAIAIDSDKPHETVDISNLPLFKPSTKAQFEQLRKTLGPILLGSSKKPHYVLFLQEFCKQLARDLPSDQIKKIASTITALSNERLKEEKTLDKFSKKSKASKTKTSLVTTRPTETDLQSYGDEAYADDDFM